MEKAQCKASEIRLNNSPDSIFVGCDLRLVSSMRCLRKQMRGIVLFLNSWERDSGPNRLKLSWERVVNATYIDFLVPCLQFPSGFHLRMSAWAGPLCRSGFPRSARILAVISQGKVNAQPQPWSL